MPDRYLAQQLGRYRTTRLLGAGSFSWVYEAVDTETGAPVALKVLRPEFTGQHEAEARFRREAQTASRLRHPNIVAVRDVGTHGDAAFVAMDLKPLTLARRLQLVHRLPETEVVRIALDVASALAIAHAEGVIHRDIKPDNILLGEGGEAVVGDFGLARAIEADPSMSASQQVMGTPHYFSPEQARGQPVDGRTDLYALGITMFRAATGRVPYEGDDWYSVARQHIEAPVPSPRAIVPELTVGFDAIVTRLLAKNPELRFANATQLIDALARLPTAPEHVASTHTSGSATIIAPAPFSAAARARRSKWVRRMALAGAVAVGALVLLVVQRPPGSTLWGMLDIADDTTTPSVVPPFVFGDTVRTGNSLRTVPISSFGSDSSPRSPVLGAPPSRPGQTPTARRASVTIATDSQATVYVDGRQVGVGSQEITVPTGRLVRLRAAFPTAQPDCSSALRDSTMQFAEGDQRVVSLVVRPCGLLTVDVVPSDALITLRMEDDGVLLSFRADTLPRAALAPAGNGQRQGVVASLLVPSGRYSLMAAATGYENYFEEQVVIPRSGEARRRIRMLPRGD